MSWKDESVNIQDYLNFFCTVPFEDTLWLSELSNYVAWTDNQMVFIGVWTQDLVIKKRVG